MSKENMSGEKKLRKFGITPKLLLGILCPLIVSMAIMSAFLGVKGSEIVDEVMGGQLEAQSSAAANQVKAFLDRYYGVAECLSATQIVRDVTTDQGKGGIAGNDLYDSLLETLKLVQEDDAQNIDYVWLADLETGELLQSDGTLFKSGDIDFANRSWYKLVTDKKDTITTETYASANGDADAITVASPVLVDGTIEGVIAVDLNIQHLKQLLGQITIGESGYVTVYDLDNKIIFHPDESVVGTNAEEANYSSNMLDAILNKEDSPSMRYTRGSTEYYGSTMPAGDSGYMVLGVMLTSEYTSYTSTILRVLVIVMLCCAILLTAICIIIALSITRPLKRLDAAVGKLADGELDVVVETNGRDEVAEVGANVERIVERLREYILYIDEISSVLYQIGKGNLVFSLHQEYVGEFSKIKEALLNIRSTLTETLTSIAVSADQVNSGADQIASGAQALAQGATEQASSVQELSTAVQELSSQATMEAEKAVDAGRFLEQIKDEVEKSNMQMDTMRKAMEDISLQSTSIRTIIKTIDDIAFQTNILALNAAVEAARAGSAGKGFAVVADEVRSLAGKSAEAAQKTNELIENSVQAVKRGEELTGLTADSLQIVSDGTKQVADTIEAVAAAYHDQADKLVEISRGVDQISDVVQTNSATAEESAAASEELSGQASMMHRQISQFKLGQDSDEPMMQRAFAESDDFDVTGEKY
jgi:methyl-accepting chemotaxis protein